MDQEELKSRIYSDSGIDVGDSQSRQSGDWKSTLKYGLLIVFVFLVLGIIVYLQKPAPEDLIPTACFKYDVCLDLIIVSQPEEVEIGLSNYTSLPEDKGMLFIFEEEGIQRMWMKDMDFPIDIFWLSASGRILHIEKNAQPCIPPQCDIYEPQYFAKYVLETRAGLARDTNLYDGEKVKLSDIPRVRW